MCFIHRNTSMRQISKSASCLLCCGLSPLSMKQGKIHRTSSCNTFCCRFVCLFAEIRCKNFPCVDPTLMRSETEQNLKPTRSSVCPSSCIGELVRWERPKEEYKDWVVKGDVKVTHNGSTVGISQLFHAAGNSSTFGNVCPNKGHCFLIIWWIFGNTGWYSL